MKNPLKTLTLLVLLVQAACGEPQAPPQEVSAPPLQIEVLSYELEESLPDGAAKLVIKTDAKEAEIEVAVKIISGRGFSISDELPGGAQRIQVRLSYDDGSSYMSNTQEVVIDRTESRILEFLLYPSELWTTSGLGTGLCSVNFTTQSALFCLGEDVELAILMTDLRCLGDVAADLIRLTDDELVVEGAEVQEGGVNFGVHADEPGIYVAQLNLTENGDHNGLSSAFVEVLDCNIEPEPEPEPAPDGDVRFFSSNDEELPIEIGYEVIGNRLIFQASSIMSFTGEIASIEQDAQRCLQHEDVFVCLSLEAGPSQYQLELGDDANADGHWTFTMEGAYTREGVDELHTFDVSIEIPVE